MRVHLSKKPYPYTFSRWILDERQWNENIEQLKDMTYRSDNDMACSFLNVTQTIVRIYSPSDLQTA